MISNEAKLFKALSDPNRLRILKMLQVKDLCVCEITEVLQLAPSTVSKHLSILRQSGYILEEKEGKWVNYSINRKPSDPALGSLIGMMHVWLEDVDLIKKDRAIIREVNRATLCK